MNNEQHIDFMLEITTILKGYDHKTHESGKQTIHLINEFIKKEIMNHMPRDNTRALLEMIKHKIKDE